MCSRSESRKTLLTSWSQSVLALASRVIDIEDFFMSTSVLCTGVTGQKIVTEQQWVQVWNRGDGII